MILDILYGIVVQPIQLLVELIFSVMYKIFYNPGIAIVFVSLVVQLLVLPMYKKSDAMQEQEREKQKKMKPWIDHIKKNFQGDERFMIMQTYYRSENYNPLSTIKGSLSLLLQIPFFIAAYNYLSNLAALEGASFLLIADLSKPDQMLHFGGITLNLLPILMTLFNVIAGIIYTKGFPIKDKIQTYGLAAIFLVLLYDSPSGLVLYWTLNNLFSLVKNIFMKVIKNVRRGINIVAALFGVAVFSYSYIFVGITSKKRLVFMLLIVLICFMPTILTVISKLTKKNSKEKQVNLISDEEKKKKNKEITVIFNLSSVVLTLLLGVTIPMSVIGASPAEFVSDSYGPIGLIIRTLAVYVGIILLWVRIFYMLSSDKGKKLFAFGTSALAVIAAINFYGFGRQLGTLSTYLTYDILPEFSTVLKAVSLILVVVVGIIMYLLLQKKQIIIKRVCQIGVLTLSVLAVYGSVNIVRETPQKESTTANSNYEKILPLSKNGQNVIVFMVDRAISGFLPYFMNEKPELKEMYDGFTYYPNTVSFAALTNMATGPLFGGYDYMPSKVNERSDMSLKDKQNEALLVMPKLFSNNDFTVTVTDPPYANYSKGIDVSLFDRIEGAKGYQTIGMYADSTKSLFKSSYEGKQKHNFIYYSAMKACPVALQSLVYNNGEYYSTEPDMNVSPGFINNYTVLTNLANITEIKDDSSNNFLMMQNETTHEPVKLQQPGYTLVPRISGDPRGDLSKYTLNGETVHVESELQISHYDTNMAALLRIGEWLDFLKKEGVYDNTRIIIVADHGRQLEQFDSLNHLGEAGLEDLDAEAYNPLLLVKDFNAKGFTTSDEFMTNADVPALAVDGIIKNPVNPYTDNKISTDAKHTEELLITTSGNWTLDNHNGYTFNTSDGYWYSVRDNIFDKNNWKKVRKGEE